MGAIREIKKELSELRISMEKLTEELHETNIALRESLKLTSESIRDMSKSLKTMSDLTIQLNVRETILKNLGIDDVLPDFLKKKK